MVYLLVLPLLFMVSHIDPGEQWHRNINNAALSLCCVHEVEWLSHDGCCCPILLINADSVLMTLVFQIIPLCHFCADIFTLFLLPHTHHAHTAHTHTHTHTQTHTHTHTHIDKQYSSATQVILTDNTRTHAQIHPKTHTHLSNCLCVTMYVLFCMTVSLHLSLTHTLTLTPFHYSLSFVLRA